MQGNECCKLILLGNGSVGKSSIIQRFLDDGFSRMYKQTVGLDFFEKKITLKGDEQVTLQVWDIGGQSLNSNMLGNYIYGAHVILLCYDITNASSFADLEDWNTLIMRTFDQNRPKRLPHRYLIGNKVDLLHLRTVTIVQHDRFIQQNQLNGGYFISAQNGDNVVTSFYRVASQIANIPVTEYDLAFTNKVIKASVLTDEEGEGRTAMADEIEQEDLRNEARKHNMLATCQCILM